MTFKATVLFVVLLIGSMSAAKIGLIVPETFQRIAHQAIFDAIGDLKSDLSLDIVNLSKGFDFELQENETTFDLVLDYSGQQQDLDLANSTARITLLDSFDPPSSFELSSEVIVRSNAYSLTLLALTLIDHYKFSKTFIFHDVQLGLDSGKRWLASLMAKRNFTIDHHFLEPNNTEELVKTLRKLKRRPIYEFFIIGKPKTINLFFDQVQANDMFRASRKWIAITRGLENIKCSTCLHSKYTVVRPKESYLHEYETSRNFISVSLDNRLDYSFYHDLTRLGLNALVRVMAEKSGCKTVCRHSNSFSEFFNDQASNEMGRFGSYYSLRALTKRDGNGLAEISVTYQQINFEAIGYSQMGNKLTKKRKFLMEYSEPLANIVKSSMLLDEGDDESEDEGPITMVTLIQAPFVMKRTANGTSGTGQFYGFLVDILDEIKRELGPEFPEYEIVEDESGLYGTCSEASDERSWTGIASSFDQGEYDFGLVAMTMAGHREFVMDFTEPIFDYVGITALMRKPSYQDHFFVYITVLEGNVWLCIFAAYVLTGIVIAIFDYYSPYSRRYLNGTEEGDDRVFTLKESLWFCFTSLTPQGGGEGPRALSGRLVIATWWLFGFIVIASYTANLAAFLTVSRLDRNIQTFEDLTKQYKVRYSPIDFTATNRYFELMALNEERYYEIWKDLSLNDSMAEEERSYLAVWEYPVGDKYTKIWAQMDEIDKPQSFESAVRKIRASPSAKEGYGLIGEAPSIKWIELSSCDLLAIGSEFAFRPLAFPVKKGDPRGLKKKIDPIMRKMKEDGRLERLRLSYWDDNPKKRKCRDYRKLSDGIPLRNSGGMFLIIIVGLSATLFLLSVENCLITYFKQFDLRWKGSKSIEEQPRGKNRLFRRMWGRLIMWLKE